MFFVFILVLVELIIIALLALVIYCILCYLNLRYYILFSFFNRKKTCNKLLMSLITQFYHFHWLLVCILSGCAFLRLSYNLVLIRKKTSCWSIPFKKLCLEALQWLVLFYVFILNDWAQRKNLCDAHTLWLKKNMSRRIECCDAWDTGAIKATVLLFLL